MAHTLVLHMRPGIGRDVRNASKSDAASARRDGNRPCCLVGGRSSIRETSMSDDSMFISRRKLVQGAAAGLYAATMV
ncbi:hypothetical protein ACS0X5_08890, partial [Burkholderia gladioli]|uniref:hypothetical protein n=1 Tax=Burkholderia gladioli TaxID=28095 RepID=UPI003F7ADE4B